MLIALIVIVVIIVGLVAFGISGFNKLKKADIGAQEALGGIDVQLTRRADLIPNLVNTVKGYAAHESGVFEAVTAARSRVSAAAKDPDVPEKAAADQQLSQALVNVMAVAEAYPDLKANQQFLDLQKQLADTENQISFARQYYNDAVTKLNSLVQTIPWMFFAGIAQVSKRDFYKAPEGQEIAPTVSFDPPAAPAAPAAPPAPAAPAPPAAAPPAAAPPAPPAAAPAAPPAAPPAEPPAPPPAPPAPPAAQ